MSRTVLPRSEGAIPFERKITIPVLIAMAGLLLGAGVGYATHIGRTGALEIWRAEKERADAVVASKVSEINERTIRIEENLKFVRAEIERRRP